MQMFFMAQGSQKACMRNNALVCTLKTKILLLKEQKHVSLLIFLLFINFKVLLKFFWRKWCFENFFYKYMFSFNKFRYCFRFIITIFPDNFKFKMGKHNVKVYLIFFRKITRTVLWQKKAFKNTRKCHFW